MRGYWGGCNGVTKSLKLEERIGRQDQRDNSIRRRGQIAGFEDGGIKSRAKGCGQLLEAGKVTETDL